MALRKTEIQNKYDAKNCRHFSMKLNYKSDGDVIEKLLSVPSVQAYVKQLVRQDLAQQKSVSVPDSEKG